MTVTANEFMTNISKYLLIIGDEDIVITKNELDNRTAWEEIKDLYGIVRSDIDEKAELAAYREERYGNIN